MRSPNYFSSFAVVLAVAASIGMCGEGRTFPIEIVCPRGGEVFVPGQKQTIILGSKTLAKFIQIELSRDGGTTFESLGIIDNQKRSRSKSASIEWSVTLPSATRAVIRATSLDEQKEGTGTSKEFSIAFFQTDISQPDGRYVLKGGDTMSGALTLSGDPVTALHAATKQYVDSANSTQTATIDGKVNRAGDTMTGTLNVTQSTNNRGVDVQTTGTGNAGFFQVSGPTGGSALHAGVLTGNRAALTAGSDGTQEVARFVSNNTSNTVAALYVEHRGLAPAGTFQILNNSSTESTLYATTSGTGKCLVANHQGSSGDIAAFQSGGVNVGSIDKTGTAAFKRLAITGGSVGGSVNPSMVLNVENAVSGSPELHLFGTANVAGAPYAIEGIQAGVGAGPLVIQPADGGLGVGTGSSNPAGKLHVKSSSGFVYGLVVDQAAGGSEIAGFRTNGTQVARIDNTGKSFFNGGTQTGGADLAEAFEVEGSPKNYEPGDLLVISTKSDRTVKKSLKPYDTSVAGVLATKPGVLLTERDLDADLTDTVPMGVVGVIPTKVSSENGIIKRGDLLVSSSIPGHAMKGTDRKRMTGAIIGKALENFDGEGSGVIKVLVNVK